MVQRKTTATTFLPASAETQRSHAFSPRSHDVSSSSAGGETDESSSSVEVVVIPEWDLGPACPVSARRGKHGDAPFRPAEVQALSFSKAR